MDITVLVVDDSKLARMVVTGCLGRLQPSWRAVEAPGAPQALEMMSAGGIDIALVDYNMAGMDGLALAARIREARPDMPIAIVSANAQDAIVAEARKLDVAFIEKPLSDAALAPFLSGAALGVRRSRG